MNRFPNVAFSPYFFHHEQDPTFLLRLIGSQINMSIARVEYAFDCLRSFSHYFLPKFNLTFVHYQSIQVIGVVGFAGFLWRLAAKFEPYVLLT